MASTPSPRDYRVPPFVREIRFGAISAPSVRSSPNE